MKTLVLVLLLVVVVVLLLLLLLLLLLQTGALFANSSFTELQGLIGDDDAVRVGI